MNSLLSICLGMALGMFILAIAMRFESPQIADYWPADQERINATLEYGNGWRCAVAAQPFDNTGRRWGVCVKGHALVAGPGAALWVRPR